MMVVKRKEIIFEFRKISILMRSNGQLMGLEQECKFVHAFASRNISAHIIMVNTSKPKH